MMKKNIALITGGSGGELEISLNSAKVINNNLDNTLFNVYLIVIEGYQWYYNDFSGNKIPVNKNNFSLPIGDSPVFFDCVFIAIHGTPGEDGKLQGYFDLLNIPYTACDVCTSSLTFNKYLTNQVVENLGLKTGKMQIIRLDQEISTTETLALVGLPCFVKPNKGGSSVGTSKVKEPDELSQAIVSAFRHDDEVLVQQYLKGREITCGLFRFKGKIVIFPLCEIVSKNEFFDYEAKYTDGMADEIVPARINDALSEKCRQISAFLYDRLNCQGIVRFDYILNEDDFYFLEVNTIPGLSENSIVPKMARNMGLSIRELFTMVIEESMRRHKRREKYFNPDNSSETQ